MIDVPTILGLIHDLAAYEKSTHAVEATEDRLRNTLSFPSDPNRGFAKALLLSPPSSSQPVGLALYFHNYSTWRARPGVYLEDLFVKPEYRGKGYGKALFKRLAQEALKIGGGRLEWSCLNWNTSALGFYQGWAGAEKKDEWCVLRLDGEEKLRRLAEKGDVAGGK